MDYFWHFMFVRFSSSVCVKPSYILVEFFILGVLSQTSANGHYRNHSTLCDFSLTRCFAVQFSVVPLKNWELHTSLIFVSRRNTICAVIVKLTWFIRHAGSTTIQSKNDVMRNTQRFNKSSATAEVGDRGHNRHGPNRGGLLCPFRGE